MLKYAKGKKGIYTPVAALYGSVASAPPAFLKTDDQTDAGGSSTITFSTVNFGTAASNRIIIAMVTVTSTAATGVTIGGVTAVKEAEEATGVSGLQIWRAAVPSGTSGSIVITAGISMTNAIILVGQATNITAAAVSNGHFTSSTSDPLSFGTITVPSTGFGIAAIYNTGPSIGTWANATSQYELDGASAGSAVMGLVTATGATSYSNPGTTTAHGVFACWGP